MGQQKNGDKMVSSDEDDMSKLDDTSVETMLAFLQKRFAEDKIFSRIGPVLVVLNPYKRVKNKTSLNLENLAKDMFHDLINNFRSQACIVSGDSGAGKTESTKQLLAQIGKLSNNTKYTDCPSSESAIENSLQKRIQKTSPILEAFGNATTVRNNNSSRFGKLIEITINSKTGNILKGTINNYLLEKSRLCGIGKGERNFHIFYLLLAHQEISKKIGLDGASFEDFSYLKGSIVLKSKNDDTDMKELLDAMNVVGLQEEEQVRIFELLGAILRLGQVNFEDDPITGGSNVIETTAADSDNLDKVVEYLGVKKEDFIFGLTKSLLTTNKDRTTTVKSASKATESRDALAKNLYERLFYWITEKVTGTLYLPTLGNESKCDTENLLTISILDAFGFESFDENSFEQLCINFCNEKLQYHFNNIMVNEIMEEYASEGIELGEAADDAMEDNAVCLEMLGQIYKDIDEQSMIPGGSDKGLLQRLMNSRRKKYSKHLLEPHVKKRDSTFTVSHYAGNVDYNVNAFLMKNKDVTPNEILNLCQGSRNRLVSSLFENKEEQAKRERKSRTRKGKQSLGAKFKANLDDLSKTLFTNESKVTFIKCIKPNPDQIPTAWCNDLVMKQLHYCGLVETARIRAIGFPVVLSFKLFMKNYGFISGKDSTYTPNKENVEKFCKELTELGCLINCKKSWAVGKTKIFFKEDQHKQLQLKAEERIRSCKKIQNWFRYIQRVVKGRLLRVKLNEIIQDLRTVITNRSLSQHFCMRKAIRATEQLDDLGINDIRIYFAVRTIIEERKLEAIECVVRNLRYFILKKKARISRKALREYLNCLEDAVKKEDVRSMLLFLNKITSIGYGDHPRLQKFDKEVQHILNQKSKLIYRFFVRALQLKKARKARAKLKQLISRLNVALRERNYVDMETSVKEFESLGYPDHYLAQQVNEMVSAVEIMQRFARRTSSRGKAKILRGKLIACIADIRYSIEKHDEKGIKQGLETLEKLSFSEHYINMVARCELLLIKLLICAARKIQKFVRKILFKWNCRRKRRKMALWVVELKAELGKTNMDEEKILSIVDDIDGLGFNDTNLRNFRRHSVVNTGRVTLNRIVMNRQFSQNKLKLHTLEVSEKFDWSRRRDKQWLRRYFLDKLSLKVSRKRVCWVDVNKLQVAINDARKSKVVDERLEEASSLLEKVKGYLEERRNSRFFQANNNDNGNNNDRAVTLPVVA